jgi:hypothetical protein
MIVPTGLSATNKNKTIRIIKMTTTTTTTTTTTVVTETTTTQAPKLKTRLIFVLDRSGSMGGIADEAIGGFNAFVAGQKQVEGEATLSLVIFDNVLDTIHDNVALETVPTLTSEIYIPRGMTALFDAIGVTIAKYLAVPTDENTKTIFAVLTDGEENASQEFSGKAVADLIKKVETEHKWEVMFLGANINVQEIATQLNVQSTKFAAFAASAKGIDDTFKSVNAYATSLRSVAKGASLETTLQSTYDSFASQ